MTPPFILLDHVRVEVHSRRLLDDVTWTIQRGEYWTLAGPNGAGKSTLLQLIIGLSRPTSGTVRIQGNALQSGSLLEWRRRVGWMPQQLAVDPGLPMTARDIILTGRTGMRGLFHRFTDADHQTAESTAAELQIAGLLDRPFGLLSGGERQKVLLARALAQQPALLLLDEPANSLDPRAAQDFHRLLAVQHQRHALTIIAVTHNITALPSACSHLALLKEGRMIAEGLRITLYNRSTLSALYGGEFPGLPVSASLNDREPA